MVNAYNFKIDLQCPQCGAPAELDETETIIQCGFCRTSNIIHTHPFPCFFITPKQEKLSHLPVVYIPYWRFKGLEFALGPKRPAFRAIDQSYIAVDRPGLPRSLGFRSQTQRLQFIQKGIKGGFLPPSLSRRDILNQIAGGNKGKVHIGEILSLIFMPFLHDDHRVYDGLTGKATGMNSADLGIEKKAPSYRLSFTPSQCPSCGWDLAGETDSLVLHCKNCTSFWLIHEKKLNRVNTEFFGLTPKTDIFMPFWRFDLEFDHLNLSTMADLIRVANIPRVVQEEHQTRKLYFYTPAFKLNPKLFLRIAKQITVAQIDAKEAPRLTDALFHPADLPIDEGFQAMLPVLMEICANKKEAWDMLNREKIRIRSFGLVYLGFYTQGSEYIQDELGFSVLVNSLKFGRKL
ncbi:MAG: hypothetical protein D3926_22175 [Desulfobacteraceae bacterium]|nr:MAG: hypothetical protein D3926_22175 [Desulfobacteraceae bacterium]